MPTTGNITLDVTGDVEQMRRAFYRAANDSADQRMAQLRLKLIEAIEQSAKLGDGAATEHFAAAYRSLFMV